MKGQRRHELEKNSLADWLAGIVAAVRPYTNAILGALLLTITAMLVYTWWTQQTSARTAKAWDAFYEAMASGSPAELDEVIEQYPGSHVAHWAAVVSGDVHLSQGCNQLFSSKATANQDLRKAVDAYLLVLDQSRESMLRERATFGLARAQEAQGNLSKAITRYQEVTSNWPKGAFTVTARRRLGDLKKPKTKAFYDKFAKYDPKPAFSDEPGTPGKRPDFDLDSLPESMPDIMPSDFMDLKETGPSGKKPAE